MGKINQMLSGIRNLTTPLQRQVDRFGRVLDLAILSVSAATFVLGTLWRNYSPSEMFMMAVALAASAVPEGLPAVEALGSVTVICSGKTVTLTRNEMTVQRVSGDGSSRWRAVQRRPSGREHLSARCDRALDRSAQLANEWHAEQVVLHVLEPAASPDQALAWASGANDEQILHV
ncbi:hypothetical protein [Noviherbaspirillum sp.]|uniref:P-type ATPase n=1 Tax=Noviherbaspirillum sp. TaxID=1926288 RepID=UPI002B489278|nr:hypothetical protein [Noviherbaspirillum sp.]HJV81400.1 hypothetical protein [Noviherbaspirillum sp.]